MNPNKDNLQTNLLCALKDVHDASRSMGMVESWYCSNKESEKGRAVVEALTAAKRALIDFIAFTEIEE